MNQNIKTYILLFSIFIGGVFHKYLSVISPIIPYLLFLMLLFTFCKISFKEMKFTRFHWTLLVYQIIASYLAYFLLRGINEIIAQGVMSCILVPTACAAVVVAGILGASMAFVASYTFLCNLSVAIFAPLLFTIINNTGPKFFFYSAYLILWKIFPILVLPMIIAVVLNYFMPKITLFFSKISGVSFYLWVLTVTVVIARTINFVVNQENPNYVIEILLAIFALILCLFQFYIGRKFGKKYGDEVAGGQSLGQKNTALMIWLVQSFLNPIASVACASYILWQNIVNSYQLYKNSKRNKKLSYINK